MCQGGATAPGGGVGCSGAVLSECLERAWIRAAELQWTMQRKFHRSWHLFGHFDEPWLGPFLDLDTAGRGGGLTARRRKGTLE